jgi:hypothetical protein
MSASSFERVGAGMTRTVAVTLLLGLAAAGLSGCYVVSPYAAPAYSSPPPYAPPGASAPSAPRPGAATTPAPPPSASPSAPRGSAQNCQTITVEGHSETIVRQSGQRETVWVPTHQQHVCQ